MSAFIEHLEDSIETLAMLHNDMIEVTCPMCKPEIALTMNCSCNDIGGESVHFCKVRLKEFEACPIALIPPLVYELYDMYYYHKEFGGAPPYRECDGLFWWFTKTYSNYYNKYQNEKMNPKGGLK